MKNFFLLLSFLVGFMFNVNSQCTSAPYGAWGSLTPTCNGTYQNVTTCGYRGEYSTVGVTAGNNYSFQSSIASDYITIATTGNAPLVWGTGTVTWTATFSGQVRFFTHTNSACGAATGCMTRRVMCTGAAAPSAPCTNTIAFGSITAPTVPGAVTISTCTFQNEYNTIFSIVAGNSYTIGSSCGGYITVRRDAFNGTVVGHGAAPFTFTAPTSGTYYIHYNTNSSCGTATNCCTTTVTCTSCAPPPPGPCIQPTPFVAVNAPNTPTSLTISTCTWAGEYNTINSVVNGQTYEFSSSIVSDWLTLTDASNNSLVFGTSPITWTATFSGTVRLHVSTGSNCGTQNSCRTTTVTCTSCVPLTPGPCSNPNPFAISNMPTQINPVVTISCPGVGQFTNEYSEWLNGVAGTTCITSSSISSDWITVRFGSPNGTVVDFGSSPLTWTAPNNGTYYIHVNANGFCEQDLNCRDVTVQRESPLPVTLLSFVSECDGGISLLKWTTASEQNSDYFQIERSRDGFEWRPVSQVQASGNSNTNKNYQFYDMTAGRFEGYYQLKQVDFDGQFAYFGPVYSNCVESVSKLETEVFPNPTSSEIFIRLRYNQEEDAQILIVDNPGRVLTQENIRLTNGYLVKTIDLSNLQSGMYQIFIITRNNKYIHKIVKK